MSDPNNQDQWNKRALFGYKPEYVKARFAEMEQDFFRRKEFLEKEIQKNKDKRNALLDEMERMRIHQPEPESYMKPSDEQLSSMLFQKHMEVTGKLVSVHQRMDAETKQLKEIITAKKDERDYVLSQLKEGLQKLHETFSKSRGV